MAHRQGEGIYTGSGVPKIKLQGMPSAVSVSSKGIDTRSGPARNVVAAPGAANLSSAAKKGAEEARTPRN